MKEKKGEKKEYVRALRAMKRKKSEKEAYG